MSKKLILAGGSGFLGRSFADYITKRGYEAVILSRRKYEDSDSIKFVVWDGKTIGNWCKELEDAEAVVNFTGKSVNCIYTEKNKKEIIDSRVNSVKVMDEAVKQAENPPKIMIQAGSLAIYGDTTQLCDEDAAHGEGFSVEVSKNGKRHFLKRRSLIQEKSCSESGLCWEKTAVL